MRRYAGFVRALIARRARSSDLEDIAQDVFIAVLRNHHRRGRESIIEAPPEVQRAWLYRATLLEIADRRRSSFRTARREERYAALLGPGDTTDDYNVTDDVMARARAQLSDPDEELLVARFVDGLSSRELALAAGVSEVTLRQRLSRALRRLRHLYIAAAGGVP